jgi:hypothetical protein
MHDRGVLYMVWGNTDRIERALDRSRKSLASVHPELPVEVIRLETKDPFKGLLEKAQMFERTPFRQTLFLDADTVVLDRLDFGFQKAEQFGIACCICECPWACRYGGIQGDIIEYNTGVLFFSEKSKSLFERWANLAPQIDSSIHFLGPEGQKFTMPYNDQGSFAVAVEESSISPFVLPMNWNFRPQWNRSFFGPMKIWHDYAEVPPFFYELRKYYNQPGSVIQYHAAMR